MTFQWRFFMFRIDNSYFKHIQLGDISRFRQELMGIAMLFIILFHINSRCCPLLQDLCKLGNVGVDIFLFLSGVGLSFSWNRNPDLKSFYYRRFLRVFPTWLFFSSLFYISHFLYPDFNGVNLSAWLILLGEITINVNFWRLGDLTFWYIPALMFLYFIAPWYMILIRKYPICKWMPLIAIIWFIAVKNIDYLDLSVGHLSILWKRIPIFLIGINIGPLIKIGKQIGNNGLVFLFFLLTLLLSIYCIKLNYTSIYELLYIPLSVSTVLLMCFIFNFTPSWLLKTFSFIGMLSLEYYLIHQNFVLIYFPAYWNFGVCFFMCLLITTPLAWLFNYLYKKSISKIETNNRG